jgi:N-acetylmuramoyl-L-alanine amidase
MLDRAIPSATVPRMSAFGSPTLARHGRHGLARATRRATGPIFALFLLSLASGCGHRARQTPPTPPIVPPTQPVRPAPGYEARVDSLDSVDSSWLRGRRIALDPGHGGYFKGSMGVHGTTEAAVNLAVALELRSLLQAHGAEVFMTRDRDRDYLSPADSALRVDLAERVRLAEAFHPDFFLSIHHNADPGSAHDRNETQTYYKLGDEGPSLDAAQSLHRYLKRNLGIAGQHILPGNYFVLRNVSAPAVLTEASFLTNPDVEARLVLPEKQRLEAEALFLGLAHYFSRPRPDIVSFEALAPETGRADTLFTAQAPDLRARVRGVFDRWELRLDGSALSGERADSTLTWRPRPLAPGRHVATLLARCPGIGAARTQALAFTIARPPERLTPEVLGSARLARGRLVPVKIGLADRFGFASLDSVRIRVRARTAGIAPAETVVTARDGVAWTYLRVSDRPQSPAARSIEVRLKSATGSPPAQMVSLAAREPHRVEKEWRGFVLGQDGQRFRDALGTTGLEPRVRWLNRDGFAWLRADSSGVATWPWLAGYRHVGSDTAGPPRVIAIAGGALHGRRIALDPDGGADDPGTMGPSGTRAALYNLDVARALAAMLMAAGAEVALVRESDSPVSDVERVRVSEAFGADRYLRIGHRAEAPRIGYYFASPIGRRWAQRTRETLVSLGFDELPLGEDAQYPLQQTSCTALYIAAGRVDRAADEDRMNAPGVLRAEAYGLFLSLAREFAPEAKWPIDSLEVRDPSGRPLAGALVTLGDAFVLETDATGRIRFARTEPGALSARVGSETRREVLLDSTRGAILTGPGR